MSPSPPGLQRLGPDVQQRDPDVPRAGPRGAVRVHRPRVLRGRGGGATGGAGRRLLVAQDLTRYATPSRETPDVRFAVAALDCARRIAASRALRAESYELARPGRRPGAGRRQTGASQSRNASPSRSAATSLHVRLPRDPATAAASASSDVAVSEGGRAFRPGASTDLEPGGPPARSASATSAGGFASSGASTRRDETRTFTIRYRFTRPRGRRTTTSSTSTSRSGATSGSSRSVASRPRRRGRETS